MLRVVRERSNSEIFESIGLHVVSNWFRKKNWDTGRRTAPEFGIKPVLGRYTSLLTIDEHLASTSCYPANGCTALKLGLRSVSTIPTRYGPSFDVLVVVMVVVVVATEAMERESLNGKSVK